MLSEAIRYLEELPAVVTRLRLTKRDGQIIYSIEAKTKRGIVELFQLRQGNLFHREVTIGKGVTKEQLLKRFNPK